MCVKERERERESKRQRESSQVRKRVLTALSEHAESGNHPINQDTIGSKVCLFGLELKLIQVKEAYSTISVMLTA